MRQKAERMRQKAERKQQKTLQKAAKQGRRGGNAAAPAGSPPSAYNHDGMNEDGQSIRPSIPYPDIGSLPSPTTPRQRHGLSGSDSDSSDGSWVSTASTPSTASSGVPRMFPISTSNSNQLFFSLSSLFIT